MKFTESTKIQTKKMKSHHVLGSKHSSLHHLHQSSMGKKKIPAVPGKIVHQSGGTQNSFNWSQFKKKKLYTPSLENSMTTKTFLKTPLKFNIKVSKSNLFFSNFLMTKGHLGSSKCTKDMTNSVEGIRQGFTVFDAKKTKIACSRAFHFLKTYGNPEGEDFTKKKLDILFVNTSEQYRHLIQKVARITGQRYIHEKWVSGTLTNWSQISQSYSLFGRFHSLFGNFLKKRKIHLPLYEKARRIYSGLLPQEIQKKRDEKICGNQLIFDHPPIQNPVGLSNDETFHHHEESLDPSSDVISSHHMTWNDGFPDVIFLINPEENQNVLREAHLLKIPVIALTDSNTKISGIDYMIPGNVQSVKFVYWFLNCMTIILQKRNKTKKIK